MRSLPTIHNLELRTNLPWPTTRDTYNDDFFDILEPDADKQLVKLGRLPIEFLYAGPIGVLIVGDAVEIVVILFCFPMFVFYG